MLLYLQATKRQALILLFTPMQNIAKQYHHLKTKNKYSMSDMCVILNGNQQQYPYQGIPSLWKAYFVGSQRRCSHQSLRLKYFLNAQFPAVKLINTEVVVFQEFRSTIDNTS